MFLVYSSPKGREHTTNSVHFEFEACWAFLGRDASLLGNRCGTWLSQSEDGWQAHHLGSPPRCLAVAGQWAEATPLGQLVTDQGSWPERPCAKWLICATIYAAGAMQDDELQPAATKSSDQAPITVVVSFVLSRFGRVAAMYP